MHTPGTACDTQRTGPDTGHCRTRNAAVVGAAPGLPWAPPNPHLACTFYWCRQPGCQLYPDVNYGFGLRRPCPCPCHSPATGSYR